MGIFVDTVRMKSPGFLGRRGGVGVHSHIHGTWLSSGSLAKLEHFRQQIANLYSEMTKEN